MTNPTEPTTSKLDQFPDIQAFLRTLASYPDEVVAAAAVQAADEIQINRAERNYWRERAQSAEAPLARTTEERDYWKAQAKRIEVLAYTETSILRDRARGAEASLSQLQADAGGERLRAALEDVEKSLSLALMIPTGTRVTIHLTRAKILYEKVSLALSGGAEKQGLSSSSASRTAFQARVEPWMRECFGDVIPFDKEERGDRFLEEVFELLQWAGYDPSRVATLRDYTWGRPVGEGAQEVGGVMVTLAAFCLAHGLDMHTAGETELARIWTKVEQIRAKQAAKPRGIALPIAPASPLGGPSQTLDEPKPRASDGGGS